LDMLRATLVLGCALATSAIGVGDTLPPLTFDYGFPPQKINIAERVAGKKVIIVGLPGAFTPT